jgi:phage baseplate assembly protein V
MSAAGLDRSSGAFERIARRLRFVSRPGRTTLPADDSGNVQKMQVRLGPYEIIHPIKRLAEFGFASSPPAGSDVLAVFVAGDVSNGVVVATAHQPSRLKNLNPGEAALYDVLGRYIYLTKDNGIVIEAANDKVTVNHATEVTINASAKVTLNTPELHVTGNITCEGDVSDSVRSMADDRGIYNGHTHPVSGGDTSAPNQQE